MDVNRNYISTLLVRSDKIEECTISLHENEKEPCKLEDTKLYMDYSLVKPWLVKSDIVLERVK